MADQGDPQANWLPVIGEGAGRRSRRDERKTHKILRNGLSRHTTAFPLCSIAAILCEFDHLMRGQAVNRIIDSLMSAALAFASKEFHRGFVSLHSHRRHSSR